MESQTTSGQAARSATPPLPAQAVPVRPVPLPFLGLACAVGVSSIYFNQPLLLDMARTFHTSPGHVGLVAMATQLGYAAGLLLFVPLGDVVERRALMMRLFGAVALALLGIALAPTLSLLIVASVAIGLFASVTHIVLPLAPDLVDDSRRGRAVGTVVMGLLLGILLARTFAGWVSKIHGWQWVFVVAAVVNASFVPLLWRYMPRLPPRQRLSYGQAMHSLWVLWRTQPLLRESCTIGALVFASFSCFWTTLIFLLGAHYHLGSGVAGAFGVVGAAGALVAPLAGRMSDQHGPRWVVSRGLLTLAASYLILGAGELAHMPLVFHLAVLVIGVIVLDTGAQMTQVANQTRILGLDPAARSRLNTVYMTLYFGGAAVGSWTSSKRWERRGFNGVGLLALSFLALAALRHLTGVKGGALQPQRASGDVALEV